MLRKLIVLCFAIGTFFALDAECDKSKTAREIEDIIYTEYLFSQDVLQQFNPDDQFVNYMKGYSAACFNLYYRIRKTD